MNTERPRAHEETVYSQAIARAEAAEQQVTALREAMKEPT